MTKREAAIIGAYTGILVGSFSDLREYVEEIIGRPVFIHEMAFDSVADQIKRAATKDFMNLVIEDKEPWDKVSNIGPTGGAIRRRFIRYTEEND